MIKWYVRKIKSSIFMLFASSISYSMCITFGLFREIALRHEENTLWVSILFVITYIIFVVTSIIGLHTLMTLRKKCLTRRRNDRKRIKSKND